MLLHSRNCLTIFNKSSVINYDPAFFLAARSSISSIQGLSKQELHDTRPADSCNFINFNKFVSF